MSTVTYDNRTSDPDAPDAGKVKVYMKDEAPCWRTPDGEVHTMSHVFGSCFWETHDDTYVTHNDKDDLYEYITGDGSICPVGKYRIGVTVSWGQDDAGHNIIIKLLVNGSVLGILEMEPKDQGQDIRNWSSGFFYYDHAASGEIDLSLEFGPERDGDVARMFYAGVERWRVE